MKDHGFNSQLVQRVTLMNIHSRRIGAVFSAIRAVGLTLAIVLLLPDPALAQLRGALEVARRAGVTQSARLADDIFRLTNQGRRVEAAVLCEELAILLRREGPVYRQYALQLEQTALSFREESTPAFTRAVAALPRSQSTVFRNFRAVVAGGITRPIVVSARARRFARSFQMGAREGEQVLQRLSASLLFRSDCDAECQKASELILRWLSAPIEKRVFLAGARADGGLAQRVDQSLSADAFVGFFYAFCQSKRGILCPPEVVGAFFATSGEALVSQSTAAELSEFIPVELAAAYSVQNGWDNWFMITPSEIALGSAAVSVTSFAAQQ